MTDPVADLDPEDAKLVTLARATRARTGAAEGAAVRDLDGRTYAAASVALPSLRLSALRLCVAMAVSSGAKGLEAAVLLRDDPAGAAGAGLADDDRAALVDLAGGGVPVHLGSPSGTVGRTETT
jgi:hypothetical protein